MSKMCKKACNKCEQAKREDSGEEPRDPVIVDKQGDESFKTLTTTVTPPKQGRYLFISHKILISFIKHNFFFKCLYND